MQQKTFASQGKSGPLANSAENTTVQIDHNNTGKVEGDQGRVDDEIGVVEGAKGRGQRPLACTVDTENDGRRCGARWKPDDDEHEDGATRLAALGVADGKGNSDEPILYRH